MNVACKEHIDGVISNKNFGEVLNHFDKTEFETSDNLKNMVSDFMLNEIKKAGLLNGIHSKQEDNRIDKFLEEYNTFMPEDGYLTLNNDNIIDLDLDLD